MIQFQLNNYKTHNIIDIIAKRLNKKTHEDCLEKYIYLNGTDLEKKIAGFSFSDGIDLLIINGILEKEWSLQFNTTASPPPLIFKFSSQGEVFHIINNHQITHQLNPLQGAISSAQNNNLEIIRFPAGQHIIAAIIFLDRKIYLDKIDCYLEDIPAQLQGIIEDIKAEKLFFYEGNYSVIASNLIKEIIKDKNKDIVRSTFIEGKTLNLLSKLIKQYRDDLEPKSKQSLLRQYDIDKIVLAKNIILKQITSPPTIVELAKKVGVNQTKLKTGFKQVFDTTIKQFIITTRLETARLLLLKEELSIQNIAFEVGYTNKSHFSRIFKKQFGCLPSEYAKLNKLQLQKNIINEKLILNGSNTSN